MPIHRMMLCGHQFLFHKVFMTGILVRDLFCIMQNNSIVAVQKFPQIDAKKIARLHVIVT